KCGHNQGVITYDFSLFKVGTTLAYESDNRLHLLHKKSVNSWRYHELTIEEDEYQLSDNQPDITFAFLRALLDEEEPLEVCKVQEFINKESTIDQALHTIAIEEETLKAELHMAYQEIQKIQKPCFSLNDLYR